VGSCGCVLGGGGGGGLKLGVNAGKSLIGSAMDIL